MVLFNSYIDIYAIYVTESLHHSFKCVLRSGQDEPVMKQNACEPQIITNCYLDNRLNDSA